MWCPQVVIGPTHLLCESPQLLDGPAYFESLAASQMVMIKVMVTVVVMVMVLGLGKSILGIKSNNCQDSPNVFYPEYPPRSSPTDFT